MKKTLNVQAITNELKGESLFFTRSATPKPTTSATNTRTGERANGR